MAEELNPVYENFPVSHTATSFGNYTVVVTVNGCNSASSNIVTYTPTAITDPILDGAVSLYPNPVQKELYINNGTFHLLKYTVYSADGKEVLSLMSDESNLSISMRSLAAGIYLVRIQDRKNGRVTVRKVIKD